MKKVKAIFVVNAHEFTVVHRLPLMREAERRGYVVDALAPRGSKAFDRLCAEGFAVHGVTLSRRGLRVWEEISAIRALAQLYARLAPDVVYHATIKPVIYGTLAARKAKVPAVVNAVTGLGYVYTSVDLRSRLLRRVVNPLYRLAMRHRNQRVIFQNVDDRAVLERSGAVRSADSVLIPGSGVDVVRFMPEPEAMGQLLVALPARLLWDKGVDEFVEAARQLRSQGAPARFVLVGGIDLDNPSGIEEAQLRVWVKQGLVEWWGHIEDMRVVYRAAHIVVLPSYREGLPKVLLEAAASGRPVITTDAPGCRDAVVDGETGYLVPIKQSAALADRIAELLADPERRTAMGRAGRRRAEAEFSVERVVEQTFVVFDALLAREHRIG